jgi:hypothetical protein
MTYLDTDRNGVITYATELLHFFIVRVVAEAEESVVVQTLYLIYSLIHVGKYLGMHLGIITLKRLTLCLLLTILWLVSMRCFHFAH